MTAEVKTVGVIGTGVVGSSWIAFFLARGLKVLAASPSEGAEEKLSAYLEKIWPILGDQIGLSSGASLSNCTFVGPSLASHYDQVDFIQEAASERPPIKQKIVAEADAATRPEVIIASSSSGIPASKLVSASTKHPERVLVGHPLNPPHLLPLVEVVPHPDTSEDAATRALDFYKSIGKKPILVRQEVSGWIANRLMAVVVMEAYSLVARGIATAEDVDLCVTEGLGPRNAFSGPFMTNVLGGGGGRNGFAHIHTKLAPSANEWIKDMRENAVPLNYETVAAIDPSVQDMVAKYDMEAFQKHRGQLLVDLLKGKDAAAKLWYKPALGENEKSDTAGPGSS